MNFERIQKIYFLSYGTCSRMSITLLYKHMAWILQKVHNGEVFQNLTNVASAKYYLLRAFPENLKELSLILKNICRVEVTYVIRFAM